MKNKDRIHMLLHPEQYSDEQLDQMLDEANIPEPDVEEEWRQFKTNHKQRKRQKPIMRWAALIATVVALSGITYAAIQHYRKVNDTKVTSQQETAVQKVDNKVADYDLTSAMERNDSIRQDQQFNNVELQQIMQQLSKDYGVDVVFKNEATRSLRFYLKWEANDSIQDILDRINHFEKVHLTLSEKTITIE